MEREISHGEIYREIGVLQGKMDAIILSRTREDEEKKDIFTRLGKLENRMAQVVLVAVLASLILPPLAAFLGQHLRLNLKPTAALVAQ